MTGHENGTDCLWANAQRLPVQVWMFLIESFNLKAKNKSRFVVPGEEFNYIFDPICSQLTIIDEEESLLVVLDTRCWGLMLKLKICI